MSSDHDDLDAEWQQLQRDNFRQPRHARRPRREPVSDVQARFAANLRALRARRRLTQRALAEQLGEGFSASIVARWETLGPPRRREWMDRSMRIAGFFGVSLDELCGFQPRGVMQMRDAHIQINVNPYAIGQVFIGQVINVFW